MHQDVQYRKKMKEEDDYPLDTFCYYISEIPLGLLHYDRECLSERVYDGEGKLIEYHDHVPSLYVFAPHYHVPLYLQRRFKGYLEKAEKKQKEEEEKDRIFRQAHDCSFSNKEQIEKSEKCGCFSAAKSSRHPKSRITSLMSRLQPNAPSVIPTP